MEHVLRQHNPTSVSEADVRRLGPAASDAFWAKGKVRDVVAARRSGSRSESRSVSIRREQSPCWERDARRGRNQQTTRGPEVSSKAPKPCGSREERPSEGVRPRGGRP